MAANGLLFYSRLEKVLDVDEDEEAKAFNLLEKNFRKLFCKGNRFGRGNRFGKGRESRRRTTLLLEEHEAIVKMEMNTKMMQHENEELLSFNKDFAKTFEKLLNEKCSLESKNSKLLRKINDLEFEVKKHVNDKEVVCLECDLLPDDWIVDSRYTKHMTGNKRLFTLYKVCLKCDLLPDDCIVDSGCTKHMNGNRRLFTSYKAYDDGHVVFGSNLKGKVIGGVLNKETMRMEESLNVTFDKSLPKPKSSSSVEDDRIIEPLVHNPVRSPSLEVNASEPGHPKCLKEARGHPIEQVIGELNERTLSSKTKQA
ncbi:hypothetical protein Tco_1508444 [Tanacetum coccineum]